ncbi:hypothetical protein Plhal304r1_c020g0072481 [Plasmopara halstedii]
MFSSLVLGDECGSDARKFQSTTEQWMREALDSRVIIQELKTQNEKLQREAFRLNFKMNMMYESCADLKVLDRLGDLMQRKMQEYQSSQVARNEFASMNALNALNYPAKKSGLDDEGLVSSPSKFQDGGALPGSYKGQTPRENFHRVRVFEAEEAKLRDQLDIFGIPKLQQQKAGNYCPTQQRLGDTIDKLLVSAEEANSPMKSARQETQRTYGRALMGHSTGIVGSSRVQS